MSYEHYREEHGLDSETLLAAARAERASEPNGHADVAAASPAENASDQPADETVGAGK
jgi:hypothetical protein